MSNNFPLVVANFKAKGTATGVASWIDQIAPAAENFPGIIIIAPSMPFLSQAADKIKPSKIQLAAQNISQFEEGPYTGEVAASQISGLVQYVIIGHSERRQNFAEDDKILETKVQNAKSVGIEPIFCVQDENTMIPQGVQIVAYEPPRAIGTGNPDDPANVQMVAKALKSRSDYLVLYGGSVTGDNVKSFLQKGLVDGVLIGQRSIDGQFFLEIVKSI